MYSITIQGTHTGNYQFRNNSGQEFRSLVENIVLNCATLICSKYRIDLIYHSDRDRQEEIIKAWCKIVGKEFSSGSKLKFIRSSGRQETLENYFVSLIYLARIPDWFQEYSRQLNLTIDQEPNHPIHKEIVGCAMYLSSCKDSIYLPLNRANKHTIACHLLKNTNAFARKAAQDYLNN
jgi:hypothetical protein